jgi:predicted NAD/FAD-binding protein
MKIAIIGTGGAGSTAAWLLDPAHEIEIYERNETIGGHANTVEYEVDGVMHYIDDGFNWFSKAMYPRYLALLAAIECETLSVPMTASFWDSRSDRSMSMPPLSAGRIGRLMIEPSRIVTLLRLAGVLWRAEKIVHEKQTQLSARDFLEQHKLNPGFADEFLVPFMSGAWGCPHERTLDMSIYPLMKYIVLHKPSGLSYYNWQVIKGGCNAYIRKVHERLKARARCSVSVKEINRGPDGLEVVDTEGEKKVFEHVILTCGARDATKILSASRGFEKRKEVLEGMEYYKAHVASHTDSSYMPTARHDWAVANVRYTGDRADMTIWDGWRSGKEVFDTYIDPNGEMPKGCKNVSPFWLPMEDPKFFRQQAKLADMQGEGGLWVCGDYTQDLGGHEDAVASALDAVRAIEGADAQNPRSALLQGAADRHFGASPKALAAG